MTPSDQVALYKSRREKWKAAGVPALYAETDLYDPTDPAAPPQYAAAAEMLRRLPTEPATIILCGADTYRRGKTHLACSAVKMFCHCNMSAIYTRAFDIFAEIKSTYGQAAKRTTTDVLNSLYSPALLVIDEFQVRGDTAWEGTILRSLVDRRHAEQLSTILIGNIARAALREYLDHAVIARIDERGGAIECNWPQWWKIERKAA